MRLCSVSVDLDEIVHYFGIHGLSAPPSAATDAVYRIALDRLEALADSLDIPLTLFAIGSDLAASKLENRARLKALVDRGHEVANHTRDHLYHLTRLDRSALTAQVAGGIEIIRGATGATPTGFRAPGYVVTDKLFEVLRECGVAYDSSVFPCPPYYLAKALALGMIRLRRRSSHSVLDTASVLRAPTGPYRVGTPYWRVGSGMLELPVQVTRGPRLPFIGTTLTLAGPRRARWLTRMVVGEPMVNLELHGIDVLDESDGLSALAGHQPDVRVPVARKLDALSESLGVLRSAGYSFVRLDEAAARFS